MEARGESPGSGARWSNGFFNESEGLKEERPSLPAILILIPAGGGLFLPRYSVIPLPLTGQLGVHWGSWGEDPGFGAQATASQWGGAATWMVVDSKMPIAGYRVLQGEEVGQMDHSPVLLRVGLGKAGRNIARLIESENLSASGINFRNAIPGRVLSGIWRPYDN